MATLPLRIPAGFRLRRMTSQHAKRAQQRPSARQAGDARRIEAYRANSKATPEFPRVVKGAAPSAQATCDGRAAQQPKEKSCRPRCRSTAICSPDGIRTHATAVRGRRLRPLDDGAKTIPYDPHWRAGGQHSSPEHAYLILRLAGVPGLEPRMAEPESAVLPITPYPTGHL